MKNLYTLLIGINDYPDSPLHQCGYDVERMTTYCQTLQSHFTHIYPKILTDQAATKSNIQQSLLAIFEKIQATDSLLIYFSGHGAQEIARSTFTTATNQLLEGIVCLPTKEGAENYLLSNKELRYLFSKCPTNPHILSVFDCCHSGNMFRGAKQSKNLPKRISQPFPERQYQDFLFQEEITLAEIQKGDFTKRFPFKNNLHISACQSNQLAWETAETGGVFTNYLLKLLAKTNNHLNYQALVHWAKIGIRLTTEIRQTPTLSTHGNGITTAFSNWLNLSPARTNQLQGALIYNRKLGWIYTYGQLMGIQNNTEIDIQLTAKKTITTKLKKVNLEDALVDLALDQLAILDQEKIYPVKTKNILNSLKIYLNDLDNSVPFRKILEKSLLKDQCQLTSAHDCDFYLNCFNQQLYFSMPNKPYRPLHYQINGLLKETKIVSEIQHLLPSLQKWIHFKNLHNPDQFQHTSPIKVELLTTDNQLIKNITNQSIDLNPKCKTTRGLWFDTFKIKVTNISDTDYYLTVLTLGSDMSITAKPFDQQSILLPKGESQFFYKHLAQPIASAALDAYKAVYNWEAEWFHYQFILHYEEDFSSSIPACLQPGLPSPILRANWMNIVRREKLELSPKHWAIYTSTIRLINPDYQAVTGELALNWEHYKADRRLWPFIQNLYPQAAIDTIRSC